MLPFNSAMVFFVATKICRIPLSAGIRSLLLPLPYSSTHHVECPATDQVATAPGSVISCSCDSVPKPRLIGKLPRRDYFNCSIEKLSSEIEPKIGHGDVLQFSR